jgi:hypothetical protein
MKTMNVIPMMIAALLVTAASRPAHAWSRPELNLAAGTTLNADGVPSEGGASVAVSPMWGFTDRARFGVSLFADDIGGKVGHLYDPNIGSDLGLAAFTHRWTWGAAWRGDVDVIQHGRWSAMATGTWGYSRTEDDQLGATFAAASAVGVGLGGEVRRTIAPRQTLGVVMRWQRLFAQRNASYRRVTHYATAGLEWGWGGAPRP